jgi:hypothetical protein
MAARWGRDHLDGEKPFKSRLGSNFSHQGEHQPLRFGYSGAVIQTRKIIHQLIEQGRRDAPVCCAEASQELDFKSRWVHVRRHHLAGERTHLSSPWSLIRVRSHRSVAAAHVHGPNGARIDARHSIEADVDDEVDADVVVGEDCSDASRLKGLKGLR